MKNIDNLGNIGDKLKSLPEDIRTPIYAIVSVVLLELERLSGKFDQFEERLGQVEERLTQLGERFSQFDQFEERLGQVEERLTQLGERFSQIESYNTFLRTFLVFSGAGRSREESLLPHMPPVFRPFDNSAVIFSENREKPPVLRYSIGRVRRKQK
jgi:predicted nuclease with TOPRIM domain